MRRAKLIKTRSLSPYVRELTLDPGPDFEFEPGQWVSTRIPTANGEKLTRSYSIASAPREDGQFDMAVTRVEEGPGSNYLHDLQPGEELGISRAQGFFTQDEFERPVLMVATGTGVSPFRAMLQMLDNKGDFPYPVTLLLGVPTEKDILYREDFEEIAGRRALEFVPTLTRSDSWTGRKGRVQVHVPELLSHYQKDCDIYVCGLSKMVREVRQLLKDLGVKKDRIHTERYD